LLRRLLQAAEHLHTKLGRREQIITTLPRRIQPRHRLIQIRTNSPHQPGRRHELHQSLTHRRPALDCVPRAAARVTSAANAPRASPDRAAAALTSSNSSTVSENCTTFGRGTACCDRRRTVLVTITTHSTAAPSPGGTAPRPTNATHCGAGPIVYLWAAPVQR
jgi:hypothetical protein